MNYRCITSKLSGSQDGVLPVVPCAHFYRHLRPLQPCRRVPKKQRSGIIPETRPGCLCSRLKIRQGSSVHDEPLKSSGSSAGMLLRIFPEPELNNIDPTEDSQNRQYLVGKGFRMGDLTTSYYLRDQLEFSEWRVRTHKRGVEPFGLSGMRLRVYPPSALTTPNREAILLTFCLQVVQIWSVSAGLQGPLTQYYQIRTATEVQDHAINYRE